jgi:hypothetical protein
MENSNRIIKFRAWDKNNDAMFIEIETGITFEDESHYKFSDFLENDERWEVMQFTGLSDKLGKGIYEGDILEYENKRIEEVDFMNFIYSSLDYGADEIVSDCKVIGNIYENPELIK